MEKTLEVQLKEQREQLLETIAKNFEQEALIEIDSNYHSPNDTAIIARAWRFAAKEIRRYK